jgi:hypothetical protein
MRIGDDRDDRGEDKDRDFRLKAAAKMGMTSPDPDLPVSPEDALPVRGGGAEDEQSTPEVVRDAGLSVLGNIADAGR